MATLTVGAGQQYSSIKAAVAASRDGDVLEIQAGTYVNDYAAINTDITLKGVGGMVHVTSTDWIPNEKGIFITNGDITFENFEISGATNSGGNAAGIRYESGDLVVDHTYFHDNYNGILGAPNSTGTVTVLNSEFANNGNANGGAGTHNLYVNDLAKLTVSNSYFHDVWNEYNLIKSRAQVTEITGSRFQDNDSNASYEIDLPNGGVAIIRDNIIEQGSNSRNPNIISFGAEGVTHSTNSLTLDGNTIINELQNSGTLVYNPEGEAVTLTNNDIWRSDSLQMPSGGNASESGTTYLTSKPTLATEWRPWDGDSSSAPAPPAQTPGTAGDDVLSAAAGSDSYIRGGEGADTITGNADHFNNINGNQGEDSIVGHSSVGDWLLGGQGDDQITAVMSSGHNIINGNLGQDNITGGTGADILRGGQGDDVIRGSGGDDWISGDLGNNTVTGGAGADTFHAMVGGVTRVTDFTAAQGDRIDLDDGVTYRLEQQGADLHVVLTSGQGGELVLANVDQASFQTSWIV
jgi:hypothetical protein